MLASIFGTRPTAAKRIKNQPLRQKSGGPTSIIGGGEKDNITGLAAKQKLLASIFRTRSVAAKKIKTAILRQKSGGPASINGGDETDKKQALRVRKINACINFRDKAGGSQKDKNSNLAAKKRKPCINKWQGRKRIKRQALRQQKNQFIFNFREDAGGSQEDKNSNPAAKKRRLCIKKGPEREMGCGSHCGKKNKFFINPGGGRRPRPAETKKIKTTILRQKKRALHQKRAGSNRGEQLAAGTLAATKKNNLKSIRGARRIKDQKDKNSNPAAKKLILAL